ncbi:entericidin A/B family lipoprotein [Paracoccus thiocyanatus]|uniref:Entericidin EcnAB n=1 Tax=Paracoccus thiocyanatus TaxID=34006 RepID=A0A3D8PDC3_9RHOB|nr:entericidin A/B family lipoprotein [Paracoccus thiocyanatus]RDW13652.1 hypothetical protein DIE28_06955 [Paracoccus thiocyanatus]
MRRITTIALCLAGVAVAGCETMRGAGRDMQTAGHLLSEQAESSQVQMGQAPSAAPATAYMPPAEPAIPY